MILELQQSITSDGGVFIISAPMMTFVILYIAYRSYKNARAFRKALKEKTQSHDEANKAS